MAWPRSCSRRISISACTMLATAAVSAISNDSSCAGSAYSRNRCSRNRVKSSSHSDWPEMLMAKCASRRNSAGAAEDKTRAHMQDPAIDVRAQLIPFRGRKEFVRCDTFARRVDHAQQQLEATRLAGIAHLHDGLRLHAETIVEIARAGCREWSHLPRGARCAIRFVVGLHSASAAILSSLAGHFGGRQRM